MACVVACAWSPRRERGIVDAFVGRYVDGAAADGPVDAVLVPDGWAGSAEEEVAPAVAVAGVAALVALGLDDGRACRGSLPPAAPWAQAHLAFTVEGGVAVGVALGEPLEDPVTLQRATALLGELMVLCRGTHGWLAVDRPPPLDPGLDRPWRTAPHAILTG